MKRSSWPVALVLAACILLGPNDAEACSYGPMPEHVTDPAETAVDSKPPSAIADPSFTVERGHGPEGGCGSQSSDSCADVGSISIHFEPATDDRTDAVSMGYLLEVIGGTAPADSTWPSSPVRASEGNTLYLHWVDGDHDDQEAIDLTLAISAIDRGGNKGPPTELRIRHGGSDEGCRVSGSGVDLSWSLVLVALLALRGRTGG